MALHITPASMLKESLDESLEAANFCSEYRKIDEKWGKFRSDGCLGYPSAILLFSIIDSIGSYFRKDKNFKIDVDSKKVTIDGNGWEHFKILNSKYFKQNLSQDFIKNLYLKYRCCLIHNSILGKESWMIPDNNCLRNGIQEQAFLKGKDESGNLLYLVSIKELWDLCKDAVEEFKKDIDAVVPKSKQGKNFN